MTESPEQTRTERFAPYPVWAAMRVITTLGNAMALLWFFWAIATIFSTVNGGALELLPIWFGVIGLIVGGGSGSPYYKPNGTLSLIAEALGRTLAPKECPACGQSLFDHAPQSGYIAETVRHRYWPARICTNCGQNLVQRAKS